MSLKFLSITDFIITALAGFLSLLVFILIPIDAYEFITDPEDYIPVYHLDTTQQFWQMDYLKYSLLKWGAAIMILLTIIYSWRTGN
jgi:hypothetical protein